MEQKIDNILKKFKKDWGDSFNIEERAQNNGDICEFVIRMNNFEINLRKNSFCFYNGNIHGLNSSITIFLENQNIFDKNYEWLHQKVRKHNMKYLNISNQDLDACYANLTMGNNLIDLE